MGVIVFLRRLAKVCPCVVYYGGHVEYFQPQGEVVGMEFSRIRQQIRELRDEQERLLPMLMRPRKMVRGSITWQGKGEDCVDGRKRHANLVRNVDGKSETKRVRDAHVGWLKELLRERRGHVLRLRRWRQIDKELEALLTELRYESLYDYEPRREPHLVSVGGKFDGDR